MSARQFWYNTLEWASPAAYCAWSRRFPERHVVDRRTDLVVEGYPAASNSWVREAFQLTQPGIRIASHLHSAAHVRQAVRFGVPTIVLLRPPLESVASLMARYPERGYQPRTELARYRRFYGEVRKVADKIVLVRFDEAINSVGDLVGAVNRRFGSSFLPIDHSSPEFKARVFATLDHWSRQVAPNGFEVVTPRPSAARAEAIATAKAVIQDSGGRQLAVCQELYDSLVPAESGRLLPRTETTEARGSGR